MFIFMLPFHTSSFSTRRNLAVYPITHQYRMQIYFIMKKNVLCFTLQFLRSMLSFHFHLHEFICQFALYFSLRCLCTFYPTRSSPSPAPASCLIRIRILYFSLPANSRVDRPWYWVVRSQLLASSCNEYMTEWMKKWTN